MANKASFRFIRHSAMRIFVIPPTSVIVVGAVVCRVFFLLFFLPRFQVWWVRASAEEGSPVSYYGPMIIKRSASPAALITGRFLMDDPLVWRGSVDPRCFFFSLSFFFFSRRTKAPSPLSSSPPLINGCGCDAGPQSPAKKNWQREEGEIIGEREKKIQLKPIPVQ